jgi:hypothetical protein
MGSMRDLTFTSLDNVSIRSVPRVENANHPQILYWFWTKESLVDGQYLRDLDHIKDKSPFDLIFLSARNGVNFYDYDTMHEPFKRVVDKAHSLGLKIGLQLWPDTKGVTAKDAQAIVVDGECQLGDDGSAQYTGRTRGMLEHPVLSTDLLSVVLFQKAGDGLYRPGTAVDATSKCVRVVSEDAGSVSIRIEAGKSFAGYTAFVLTAHYHRFGDLFGDYFIKSFSTAMERYSDIPFDGAALDEFGFMRIIRPWQLDDEQPTFRGRFYSPSFADRFYERTGTTLRQTLFDMRYAPEGHAGVRASAINRYFDVHREGPLRIENSFYEVSKRVFGESTFIGVHDTFHNSLTNDEVWTTGINWWDLPREYGQTDEDINFPVRMGVAASCPVPVLYDMFYHKDVGRFYAKAVLDARYNGRLHYHAYNDRQAWGVDLADDDFLRNITPIEEKIRLLNHFDGPLPKMDLLIVFGFPALLNWYPDEGARNAYDINGGLHIMEKAKKVWDEGYLCALVPSTAIERGKLLLDEDNTPVYGGHRFKSILYLYPEYSKESTVAFLERFVEGGGKLMLEGSAAHDFGANDISERFRAIYDKATCRGFDLGNLGQLGIEKNKVDGGCFLEDGSVVMTDLESISTGRPRGYEIRIGDHVYSGEFAGILGLKVDSQGYPERFTCGGFTSLRMDDQVIMSVDVPMDIILLRGFDGKYQVTLVD